MNHKRRAGFPLQTCFDSAELDPRLRWFCEPPAWRIDTARRCLEVETGTGTDFWQRTHYGFSADNGHFLFAEVPSDFVLTARVRFSPTNLYDQAGVLVRQNSDCWIKAAVEHESAGPAHLGAVVTHGGYSDWSVQDFPRGPVDIALRVTRKCADFLLEYSVQPDNQWSPLRIAHLSLPAGQTMLMCGIYACSPNCGGFRAEFPFLEIRT
jgi:hypothetical protein